MKLFKSIDEKFAEIGFEKIEENEFCCVYSRYEPDYCYHHLITIGKKASGRHIIQSYDSDSPGADTVVGLTGYEMKLAIKKMKQMGLYSGKEITKL